LISLFESVFSFTLGVEADVDWLTTCVEAVAGTSVAFGLSAALNTLKAAW